MEFHFVNESQRDVAIHMFLPLYQKTLLKKYQSANPGNIENTICCYLKFEHFESNKKFYLPKE
eukprot:snap_masked-scaffold_3-processed-gene-4.33-mRNA-1 protein AED:1.00 eAED:1.00 QI:0/0/0/0/1/1/2/0/62